MKLKVEITHHDETMTVLTAVNNPYVSGPFMVVQLADFEIRYISVDIIQGMRTYFVS